MNTKYLVIGFFALGLAVLAYKALAPVGQDPHSIKTTSEQSGAPLVDVDVPELSGLAAEGKVVFDQNCAACHGENASGKDGFAPPLVHEIYEPNHHGDASFQLAVKNGVRSHHWRFGNMPRIEGVNEQEVDKIIAYVRALQKENGIF